jgi:glycerophosphoryl diester phosphodiesterase
MNLRTTAAIVTALAMAVTGVAVTRVCYGTGGAAAQAQEPLATLTGFARLAPDTFTTGPPSGRFRDNGVRGQAFPSQPVQGVSAIVPAPGRPGWWLALSDNGYGVRWNSPDFLLCYYHLRPNWRTPQGGDGTVEVGAVVRLADPSGLVPFHLVRDETSDRWLTGSDFDPESFVRMPDGTLWVGDEFGPFLLRVDEAGRVLAAPAGVPGFVSADRPGLPPPDAGGANVATVRRSRGFEGMAAAPDGVHLLAMLEGPTTEDPPDQARILEFDPGSRAFTGRVWHYRFDQAGYSVTELVPYGDSRYLVIERDNRHGADAQFKKVFAIRLGEPGPVTDKTLVVDLLAIADPQGLGGRGALFTFPFITTEAVWVEDERTLVLANDNNYPATGGRVAGERDGTEFIRIRLTRPLPR